MLIRVFTIFLSFLLPLIYGLDSEPTILNSKSGAICSRVKQHKGKGSIKVYGTKLSQDIKIPTFIFHYIDLLNFTNIPRVEKYYQDYPNNDLPNDLFLDDKFNIIPNKKSQFDSAKIYNGYIDSTKDVEFIVPQSGIYCVYIGELNDDNNKKDVEVPVDFKNSYGNLDYPSYMFYWQLKYTIFFSIVLFGYLFNYILRFKIGEDFKNLDSISVISKAIIFWVLIPHIMLNIYYWILLAFKNNFISSSQNSFFVNWATFFSEFIVQAYGIYTHGLLLLFSMGYGVIYYHNGDSHHYRMFPQKTFTKILVFLFIYLIITYLYLLLMNHPSEKYPFLAGFGNLSLADDKSSKWSSIFGGLSGLFSLILFILTMYNYFQTKKTIAKFPPSSNDSDSTQKVVSAFRKSILIFLVLPIVIVLIGAIIGGINMFKKLSDINLPTPPSSDIPVEDYQSVINFYALENTFGTLVEPILISSWIYFFTAVISIFFIWIKDNNGLIIDRNVNDPIEYADVSQFDVSDSE